VNQATESYRSYLKDGWVAFSKKGNVMKYKNTTMVVLGALALGLSTAGSAAAVSDTLDASNSGPGTTYWTPTVAQQTDWPYYRWNGDDWEWQHAAVTPGSFLTASLAIGAFDVDEPDEKDEI